MPFYLDLSKKSVRFFSTPPPSDLHEIAQGRWVSLIDAPRFVEFPKDLRGDNPPDQSFVLVPRAYKKIREAIARRLVAGEADQR